MRIKVSVAAPFGTKTAFTLVEVVMSVFIMMLVFSGIITCYIQNAYRAEWSGYSLAAQASAGQVLERAKAAVWDTGQSSPTMDQISQLATNRAYTNTLDIPISGTNAVFVTNVLTISQVTLTNTPTVQVYLVRVDATWPFRWGNKINVYTNTVADYFAPD